LLLARLKRSTLSSIRKDFQDRPEVGEIFFQRLDQARGPFSTLAAASINRTVNPKPQDLLDFSANIDQIGIAFSGAAVSDNIELAKEILLGANWLDDTYWSWPEPGLDDASRNKATLRVAGDWSSLTRASVPMAVNLTLSWLSMLDIFIVRGGRGEPAHFPFFLPLAARLTDDAESAIRTGRSGLNGKWPDLIHFPIANLIEMLQNIMIDMNRRMQARANPPRPRSSAKDDKTLRSLALAKFRGKATLSAYKFNELLSYFEPDAKPEGDDKFEFDIYSLNVATNLFALLVKRERPHENGVNSRVKPSEVTLSNDVPRVYYQWWQRNSENVAKGVRERPWPEWFPKSVMETVDPRPIG
jgi:hypothetical protein